MEEEIEEYYIESLVDVYEDSVTLNIPGENSINISDEDLDLMFFHPEVLFSTQSEYAQFWVEIVPHIFRVRENKRDLYFDMGINFD